MSTITFLGGTEDIGANSCCIETATARILIDVGMHPRERTRKAFPATSFIEQRRIDALICTHAHNDHIGALPFVFNKKPLTRIIATRPTRELISIMLRDSVKLIHREQFEGIERDELAMYSRDFVRFLDASIEGVAYNTTLEIGQSTSDGTTTVELFDAGHILGSAGVLIDAGNERIFHTGDVNFRDQYLLRGASFPREHFDTLICECTNGTSLVPEYKDEEDKLARFISRITTHNGSVLIPAFSLGRTQEILTLLNNLQRAGRIPNVPVYSGGLSKKISRIYDVFTYSVPRTSQGFEMTDIPQRAIDYERLRNDAYMKEPSIVVCSSGMVEAGTTSFVLAQEWCKRNNFGIAFVGYVDESAAGYALAHSTKNKEFLFGTNKVKRACEIESFRFSAHATADDLISFITDVRPKNLFLVHGSEDARGAIGSIIKNELPQTKIYLPTVAKSYSV